MVIKRNITISVYPRQTTLHIYLPLDYELSNRRYPVLYMYDGHNLFYDEDATYGTSWGLKDYLDAHKAGLIVVGIECDHEGNNRLAEYSPYSFHDPVYGAVKGTGDQFMSWVVNELKPCIDAEYRTKPEREYTAIGGSSMGGLMAVWTIARYNQVFSRAACLSSYLQYCIRSLERDIDVPLAGSTRIYLSWGAKETRSKSSLAKDTNCNLRAANIFIRHKALVYLNQPLNGTHCEASWNRELPVFMPFLFPEKNILR